MYRLNVSSGKLFSSSIVSSKNASIRDPFHGGCACRDCIARRMRGSGEMWVQRYYEDGTRPAEAAPRGIDRALFGVRDFYYQNGNLFSTYIENMWYAGREEQAQCVGGHGHRAPHPACRCGLYSFYNREGARRYGDEYVRQGEGVRGVVSAWGDIVLHESGFRSEYMRLDALIYEPNIIGFLGEELNVMPVYEKISKRLGVPLIIPEEIGSFARERGLFVLGEQTRLEPNNSWQRAGSLPGKGVESESPVVKWVEQEVGLTGHVRLEAINYTNPQRPIPPPRPYTARVNYPDPGQKLQSFQWGL